LRGRWRRSSKAAASPSTASAGIERRETPPLPRHGHLLRSKHKRVCSAGEQTRGKKREESSSKRGEEKRNEFIAAKGG